MKSKSSIVITTLFVCGSLSTPILSAPSVNDLAPLQKQGDRFLEIVNLNTSPSKSGQTDLIVGAAFSENSGKNNNSQVAPSSAVAKLSSTSLNFGTVLIGSTSSTKYVTLKNAGTSRLYINYISITGTNGTYVGEFAQTHTCGTSLAAGASCSIRITFKPVRSGTRTAVLNVSDHPPASIQKVYLSGTGSWGGRCTFYGNCSAAFPPCCPGSQCIVATTRALCIPSR